MPLFLLFFFFFDSLPFLVDQWLVMLCIPWSRCATCIFRVSQDPMFIFRLVLIGHTDCTTCNFRTTKQLFFLFCFVFLLRICVRVWVCEVECVNLTASYLELSIPLLWTCYSLTDCRFSCLLRSDCWNLGENDRPWTYLALTVSVMSFRSQSTWCYQHQSSDDFFPTLPAPLLYTVVAVFLFLFYSSTNA